MSNSSLVVYKKISPNRSSPRNHIIDTITVHCVVGQCAIETLGNIFANASYEASSNYGIGYDGKIGMFVEEKDRSWCSSNAANDNRAITIECASDAFDPYAINSKVYAALIKLCVDICKRNGIKKLVWSTNKSDRVNHKNGCNLTVHRDYANKSCPGDYIYNRLGQIAKEVNAQLGSTNNTTNTNTNTDTANELYRVRKSWNDAKSQKGAFKNLNNAKKFCDTLKGYAVFNKAGKQIYPTTSTSADIEALAKAVIRGEYGNGNERKQKLGSLYDAVQKRVNEILGG